MIIGTCTSSSNMIKMLKGGKFRIIEIKRSKNGLIAMPASPQPSNASTSEASASLWRVVVVVVDAKSVREMTDSRWRHRSDRNKPFFRFILGTEARLFGSKTIIFRHRTLSFVRWSRLSFCCVWPWKCNWFVWRRWPSTPSGRTPNPCSRSSSATSPSPPTNLHLQ